MAEAHSTNKDFRLFHDLNEEEKEVLQKIIDPEIDLTPLKEIDKLIDRLYHIVE